MHSYTTIAAQHYGAVRPPLHDGIVQDALGQRRFGKGLDVGCGVGHSSKALLSYCDFVIGVEPSGDMITKALPDPRIEYRLGEAVDLPVEPATCDLVSLAGSLPYIDVEPFAAELRRVCRPSAVVLVYDFRVDIEAILRGLDLPCLQGRGGYDHSANLAHVDGFDTIHEGSRPASFGVTPQQVAHLLLANELRFEQLADHFDQKDPTSALVHMVSCKAQSLEVSAQTWRALHRLV